MSSFNFSRNINVILGTVKEEEQNNTPESSLHIVWLQILDDTPLAHSSPVNNDTRVETQHIIVHQSPRVATHQSLHRWIRHAALHACMSVCPVSLSFVGREGATCDSSLVLAGEFVQDISRHLQVIPCYPQSTNHSVLCVALRCELRYVVHMKILVAHAVVFLVFQGTCAKGSQHS